jgi:hypothetical protein
MKKIAENEIELGIGEENEIDNMNMDIDKPKNYCFRNIEHQIKILLNLNSNFLHLDKYTKETNFTQNDFYIAYHILEIMKNFDIVKANTSEAYTKGIGIYCIKESGIKMNEYIAGYYGEVYSPWYWFEKQDIIKSKKLVTDLPDFYNIMLERHKYDPDGYDILMVDPNSKGNFASRMSHSCQPNSNTVLMVSDNKYTIGMYATKEISFGEELTFDYNSITEKEQEFRDAICLCSMYLCRGHYLILSNSTIFQEVFEDYHNFLQRNAILLYSCLYHDQDYLSEHEKNILEKYSIKNSILKKAPFWLKKWCVLTLFFIDLESKLLPIYLYRHNNPSKFEVLNKEEYNSDFSLFSSYTEKKEIYMQNSNRSSKYNHEKENKKEGSSSTTFRTGSAFNRNKGQNNSSNIKPKNEISTFCSLSDLKGVNLNKRGYVKKNM